MPQLHTHRLAFSVMDSMADLKAAFADIEDVLKLLEMEVVG